MAIRVYSCGNGDREMLSSTCIVRPRKSSMPARVTMKAGMPTRATQKPFHAPTAIPTAIEARTPTHHGKSCWITRMADTAPHSATTEPTDRSMCPAMMTITIPIARTRM